MALDYQTARKQCISLQNRIGPGDIVLMPDGRECIVLRPALHSETLEPHLVLYDDSDPEAPAPEWFAAPAGSLKVPGDHVGVPHGVSRWIDGDVFRHRNGNSYTRLAQVRTKAGEMTLYAAHYDGCWWLRPRTMFEDGRFTLTDQEPLSIDEMGL